MQVRSCQAVHGLMREMTAPTAYKSVDSCPSLRLGAGAPVSAAGHGPGSQRTFALQPRVFGSTHLPMALHEQTLRQLLASPHGSGCGQAIMDKVAEGTPLVIE